ncbi:ATP-binding protein [Flavobacterium silvisoli]|uniref:ATP-binding protein n=1 Tax=Flavobacterium silvisoli TaxID=2529433 RepID=A0A4Q9YPV0_9FLAO|nr:ATP-binding protein [Flavobacterium silvisoli]TBX64400.1 ATP-binding protein [Flavobacterium silvisoli]
MLIRFVVSNFLSFNEEKEFNMLAGSFKTHKHHVYNLGKIDVLKAAAIYGANGAGKSNLIKAVEFLQESVTNGYLLRSVNSKKFKLDKLNETKPISFEIEFSIEKKIYAYGVSFNNITVVEEWLYESGINVEDKMIFERKTLKSGKSSIKIADKYKRTQRQKLLIELMESNLLKSGELLLGKSDELNIKEITASRFVIEKQIIVIHPGSKFQNLVPALTSSNRFNNFANGMLETFDTGVAELDIENIDIDKYFGDEDESTKKEVIQDIENGHNVLLNTETGGVLITKEKGKYIVKKVISKHLNNEGKKVSFDLTEESDGTQRLLDFIPAFDGILNTEVCFIIDEIDQSLHPALLKSLVQKIMSNKNTIGQLVFTTHESNLLDLDIFRQDEIWFSEKSKNSGSTQLYSLSEFKPRYDLDIRKGYLKGRFGAIPFLAHLEDLKWEQNDA